MWPQLFMPQDHAGSWGPCAPAWQLSLPAVLRETETRLSSHHPTAHACSSQTMKGAVSVVRGPGDAPAAGPREASVHTCVPAELCRENYLLGFHSLRLADRLPGGSLMRSQNPCIQRTGIAAEHVPEGQAPLIPLQKEPAHAGRSRGEAPAGGLLFGAQQIIPLLPGGKDGSFWSKDMEAMLPQAPPRAVLNLSPPGLEPRALPAPCLPTDGCGPALYLSRPSSILEKVVFTARNSNSLHRKWVSERASLAGQLFLRLE